MSPIFVLLYPESSWKEEIQSFHELNTRITTAFKLMENRKLIIP